MLLTIVTLLFGRCTLQPHPEWELNGTKLTETDSVTYLGVTLSYVKPNNTMLIIA